MQKKIIREAHHQSWDKYTSNTEDDLHGRQITAYKVIKHLNKSEKDTVRINVIEENKWIDHYNGLWFQKEEEEFLENIESETQQGIDWITIQELQDSLKETKQTGKRQDRMELTWN
jgi:hypothetical protein